MADWFRPDNWRRIGVLPDPLGLRGGVVSAWSRTLTTLLGPTQGRRLQIRTPNGRFEATVATVEASAPSNWAIPLPFGGGVETIERLTTSLTAVRWNDYRIDEMAVDVHDVRFTNIPVPTLLTGPIELSATLLPPTIDGLIRDQGEASIDLRPDGTIAIQQKMLGLTLTTVGRPYVRDGRAQLDVTEATVLGGRRLPLPKVFDLVLSTDLPWWPSSLGPGPIETDGQGLTVRAHLDGIRRPLSVDAVLRALDTGGDLLSLELDDAPVTISRDV